MIAEEAIGFSNYFIENYFNLSFIEMSVSTFLSSSRKYRNFIATNSNIDGVLKDEILSQPMPKFVWITQICEIVNGQIGNVRGSIVIDATMQNRSRALIIAYYDDNVIYYDNNLLCLKEKTIPLVKCNYQIFSNLT